MCMYIYKYYMYVLFIKKTKFRSSKIEESHWRDFLCYREKKGR